MLVPVHPHGPSVVWTRRTRSIFWNLILPLLFSHQWIPSLTSRFISPDGKLPSGVKLSDLSQWPWFLLLKTGFWGGGGLPIVPTDFVLDGNFAVLSSAVLAKLPLMLKPESFYDDNTITSDYLEKCSIIKPLGLQANVTRAKISVLTVQSNYSPPMAKHFHLSTYSRFSPPYPWSYSHSDSSQSSPHLF